MNTAPKLREQLKELLSDAYHSGRSGYHFSTGERADKFIASANDQILRDAISGNVSSHDEKALEIAQRIALMWGHDRSQFVAKIQVAVLEAMRFAALSPPSGEGVDSAEQAEANLALAEQDARRLDWLCDNALFLVLSSKVSRGRDPEVIKPTREAIDAAIAAGAK